MMHTTRPSRYLLKNENNIHVSLLSRFNVMYVSGLSTLTFIFSRSEHLYIYVYNTLIPLSPHFKICPISLSLESNYEWI